MGTKAATAIDRLVGNRIRQRRLAIGMSQETLANSLGISITQVQKYERGTDRIGASRLYDVATILRTYLTFFFTSPGGEDNDTGALAEPESGVLADKETMELALAFARIHDPGMRHAILALVRAAEDREQNS